MSKTIDVNAGEFEKEVLQSEVPVLVDFWAEWCGPCRMMAPILDQISEKMAGKLKVVKVNVEDQANVALAQKYEIRSIPNMKLFRSGEVVKEFIGLRSEETLVAEIGEL
jgi:thioredoxin 1